VTATSSAVGGGRRRRDGLTVAGIAQLAGVSAPTVSKVLNGRAGVAPSTRRRVEEVLRERGYRRQEGSGPAAMIELAFHALDDPWAMEILRGVEEVAREDELAVVVTEMQGRVTPGRAWTEQVLARRPAGIIVVFSELTVDQQIQLSTRAIPLVVLDPTGEPMHETPSVGTTNWSGGLAATRHLLDLGHRHIAVLSGPTEWLCCRARLDGYRAAMDAAGVPIDPRLVRTSTLYGEGGLRDGAELLRLPDPPTAIVCANDLQALGVYEAARLAGVRVPDELSVVGFDDLPLVRWAGPPLTTVRQPLADMGATAARMIRSLAAGAELPQTRVELATSLVVRQSTSAPQR
jgi:LacI family xylobiose transport system transcriptional regulator